MLVVPVGILALGLTGSSGSGITSLALKPVGAYTGLLFRPVSTSIFAGTSLANGIAGARCSPMKNLSRKAAKGPCLFFFSSIFSISRLKQDANFKAAKSLQS